jgi:type I restriction enzyme S subunit
MSDELPQGWESVRLAELVVERKGKKPAAEKTSPNNGFVPYLDIQAIEKGIVNSYAEIASSRLGTADDIFVVWDGARSGWAGLGREGAIGSTIMALQPKAGDRNYIYRWVQSQFQHINTNTRGTGIPHVDPELFWNLEVPLAPHAEQRRIAAKLEKLLGEVDACRQRLAKIPILLKRFRQSVLAAACFGRLTADWREKNPDAEPYAVESDVEAGAEFPPNWKATRLGTLTTLVTSGSRGWAKYYADSGSTFIRAQNINSDFLNLDDIAFVRPPESAEGLRTKVRQHDILITITGANVTKSALVEELLEHAYVSQHVALVRLRDVRLAKFLFHFIVSPADGRKQLQAAAYGQGKPGLNLENIRDVLVGLPPLLEQQQIVRRVESLFALADQIEARYAKAKAYVEKLAPSLLARAFRGELVPQDPNDEPASALLERIKKNKSKSDHARKRLALRPS